MFPPTQHHHNRHGDILSNFPCLEKGFSPEIKNVQRNWIKEARHSTYVNGPSLKKLPTCWYIDHTLSVWDPFSTKIALTKSALHVFEKSVAELQQQFMS